MFELLSVIHVCLGRLWVAVVASRERCAVRQAASKDAGRLVLDEEVQITLQSAHRTRQYIVVKEMIIQLPTSCDYILPPLLLVPRVSIIRKPLRKTHTVPQ